MALKPGDLFSLSHYEYGEAYYGSMAGMRFRVAREPLQDVHFIPPDKRDPAVLRAEAWPEPDSWRTAPEGSRIIADFPFSEEGLVQAIGWLNETHAQYADRWPT